jgi:hypothetical protein
LQRLERSFSSLAVCYAFLASLAAMLLIYARLELQASPPDWSNLIGGLIHGSNPIHSVKAAQLLSGTRSALFALREQMHTTWLFFAVFAVVWLGCLGSMQIERYRRRIEFSRRQAWWILCFTVLLFALAALYGLGTNGILAQRFPGIVSLSDFVALGVVLALPLAAWSQLERLQEEQEEAEFERESPAGERPRGYLGLNDEVTDARLAESLSRLEVKPLNTYRPQAPSEQARAAATQLIESAEAPATVPAEATAPPSVATATAPEIGPVPDEAMKAAGTGLEGFSHHLAAMNDSWHRIEAIRSEIGDWFETRRRKAIAHLDMHPGMRTSAVEKALVENFPNEKLAAIDSEWAQIRKAAMAINRWLDEIPDPGQSKSK